MIRRVDTLDLVRKDRDTMHVLQRNQQLALLSIIQVIHACNILLARLVTHVTKISQEQGIMIRTCHLQVDQIILQDLVHQIVDRDRMGIMTDLTIILNAQQAQLVVDQMIIMATRMQLIAEQWEWQMGQLTLIRLRMY